MAEAPPAAPPTAPPVPAPSAPWYSGVAGVDETIVGHWTNKGWQNKSAVEVALEATKAWKAAEGFVGVPADQIIRMPKDAADEQGWSNVWTKLGRPADPKGYDFSAIKFSDGTPVDEAFADNMRQWAFKNNLPTGQATALAQEFTRYLDTAEAAENVEKQAKIAEQKSALDRDWGPNKAANMFVASRAAAALGVDPATVAALENVVGYDKVMNMFLAIGQKIGEDRFVNSTSSLTPGVMTREQAIARVADLKKDEVWVKSYLNGDAAKVREMTALSTIIAGVARAA